MFHATTPNAIVQPPIYLFVGIKTEIIPFRDVFHRQIRSADRYKTPHEGQVANKQWSDDKFEAKIPNLNIPHSSSTVLYVKLFRIYSSC